MIEILGSGPLNTVQDLGRRGWLASGVSLGGAMDGQALAVANILAGNARTAAGIEVQLFPFRLRAVADTMIAVTGADCEVTIDARPVPSWWAHPVSAGQTLTLAVPRRGARAYVAVAGGIDVPPVLGSRGTDVRGRFGGLAGRGLARGDRLDVGPSPTQRRPAGAGWGAVPPERVGDGSAAAPVRVLAAAEHGLFADAARQAFVDHGWTVTPEANRMGYRLAGPSLALVRPVELLSHGIMPGTVQVPPSGQPIIQLADANTCGGYPKMATVIESDLWRLAQAAPGMTLRFAFVDEAAALAPLRAQARWLDEIEAARARLFDT